MEKINYLITLETVSPLVLTNRPTSGDSAMYQTLDYITGSSIRGAFIQLMKQLDKYHDEVAVTKEVNDFFMEDGYRFGNFTIASTAMLPSTAVSCKQFPGFLKQDYENNHGVRDSLIENYLNEHNYNPSNFECKHVTESKETCHAPLLTYEKQVTAIREYNSEEFNYYDANPIKKLQTGHVAIDPITQTNQNSQLYFENTIDIGELFEGIIQVPITHKEVFESLISAGNESALRVGSKRTSGFGMLKVIDCRKVKQDVPTEGYPLLNDSLADRWRNFQSICKEKQIIGKGEFAFSITFMSDAILQDAWFRYRTDLTKELLENETNLPFPDFTLEYSQVSTKLISGWNQMWQTAIDDEIAIKVGSTYLYRSSNGTEEEWINLLTNLEKTPLGKRTYDGFGVAIVCHPFHLQLEEV